MKEQRYNWPLLLRDMQDTLAMLQGELAGELGMSQGQISAIMAGTRNPGIKLKRDLPAFAERNGIKIEKYWTGQPSLEELEKFLKGPEGGQLSSIIGLYAKLGKMDRRKFLRYAEEISKSR